MKFHELKEHDSSLHLLVPEHFDEDISGISNVKYLNKKSIVFLKNKKFLNLFLETASIKQDEIISLELGVIFSEKLWLMIKDDEELIVTIKQIFKFIASTPNVDLTMSCLSKPFYDKKFSEINDIVDGRQMDTAKVHATSWIAQNAFIGEGVVIGANVKIHPGVVVMAHSKIGDDCEIYPNVVIYQFTKVGKNCRIHANASIGSDGFGYNFDEGVHHKVWHMGGVIINDNVEIGSGTCIDQGTFSPTIIGQGSKIDNLVHIGHNNELGTGTILCALVGTAGSAIIGDYSVFGGQAAIAPGVEIGKGCQVAGGSGVTSNWPDGAILGGFPARNLKEWMKGIAFVRRESLKK